MLEFSEDAIRIALRRANPWWDDADIPELNHMRAYFRSFKDLALNWNVHRSVILMGPRRVGKTVMLNQLIRQAVETGLSPRHVLFASVDDPLLSGVALEQLLFLFEDMTQHDHTDRRIVIFDEIQNLDNWEVHLKVLTDKYPNTRFIASGSAAATLRRRSQESGAGRFTDFFLPPLTFAEFLDFRNQAEKLIRPNQTGQGLDYATTDINLLNSEFVDYMNFGGYPETVLEQEVRQDAYYHLRRYVIDEVLNHDLAGLYGIQDIREVNKLLMTITFSSGQEISIDSISKNLGLARNTVIRYLDYLEAAFLIARVRRIDDTGRTFKRTSRIKVYITNPSMRAAFFGPLSEENGPEFGHLVETAVLGHYHQYDFRHSVHYARYNSGRKGSLEVDFVRVDSGSLLPLEICEVKWSDRYAGNPARLVGLVDFAKKMRKQIPINALTRTVSSTNVYDGIKVRHYPCALYCYQVGLEAIERKAPWTL